MWPPSACCKMQGYLWSFQSILFLSLVSTSSFSCVFVASYSPSEDLQIIISPLLQVIYNSSKSSRHISWTFSFSHRPSQIVLLYWLTAAILSWSQDSSCNFSQPTSLTLLHWLGWSCYFEYWSPRVWLLWKIFQNHWFSFLVQNGSGWRRTIYWETHWE